MTPLECKWVFPGNGGTGRRVPIMGLVARRGLPGPLLQPRGGPLAIREYRQAKDRLHQAALLDTRELSREGTEIPTLAT